MTGYPVVVTATLDDRLAGGVKAPNAVATAPGADAGRNSAVAGLAHFLPGSSVEDRQVGEQQIPNTGGPHWSGGLPDPDGRVM